MAELTKGFQAEENLRMYFLQNGYYVARGIPFKYKGGNLPSGRIAGTRVAERFSYRYY